MYEAGSCDRCRACIAPCPIDSDPAIRVVPADVVAAEIAEVADFLTGVTVTGGEPTMQLDGLVSLFTAIKTDTRLERLTTLVDSNGTLSQRGWERLLPVMDGAMIDLKAASPQLHEEVTGHSNEPVLDSIRFLASIDKLAEVRLLVIEGVTDTEDELSAWAGYVAGVSPHVPVRVMSFRHQGTRDSAKAWPETSSDALERVRSRLGELGIARTYV
jgi:pyruvate formate lyase activating enzyme